MFNLSSSLSSGHPSSFITFIRPLARSLVLLPSLRVFTTLNSILIFHLIRPLNVHPIGDDTWNPRDNVVVGKEGKRKRKREGKRKRDSSARRGPVAMNFASLSPAPRMHRNRTHRTGTNIAVPDSGRARATANPVGDFSRSFFRGDAREVRKEEEQKKKEEGREGPVTSAGARYSSERNCPNKGARSRRRGIGIVFEAGRAFSVTRAIDRWSIIRLPHREGVHAAAADEIELTATCRYR